MDLLMLDPAVPKPLPQLVPSATCAQCDVCCRFPEADSLLRPYFTGQEIADAVARGVPADSFPDAGGAQIELVKNPAGEGYQCPAFDPTTGRCGIYDVRPVDCQLYPLALMWDAPGERVLLGWDTKCPFMRDAVPESVAAHAERVMGLLDRDGLLDVIAAHPRLIGRFQDDVVVLNEVPRLTTRLASRRVDPLLRSLTPAESPRVARALDQARFLGPDALAAYAFPYHYMWTALLPYWWMESHETLFLFAQSPDGWFMPLPPVGPGAMTETVEEAFALMDRWNGPSSPVSRIENVMAPQQRALERAGWRCRQKDGDYLYRAGALAALAGDAYKSPRALCNRVEREHAVSIESYRDHHRAGCRALYERWSSQKQGGCLDPIGRLLLDDAKPAHGLVLAKHEHMGLTGTVVLLEQQVAAYTFGYWLTPQTWCVLLEVADRSVTGLAQWLFRATCRTATGKGAAFINAMDDAGLAELRRAKQSYRPAAIIENWVITGR